MMIPTAPKNDGRERDAFSLVEMLTAIAISTVIIFVLYGVFDQTQKALLSNVTQVDVMEGGRAASDIIARDLELATASFVTGVVNYASSSTPSPLGGILPRVAQVLPADGSVRTNRFDDLFFLTRTNKRWFGVGYRVYGAAGGVGTLYRGVFVTNDTRRVPTNLVSVFRSLATANSNTFRRYFSPVVEGVIHFEARNFSPRGHQWRPDEIDETDDGIIYPRVAQGDGFQHFWIGGDTNSATAGQPQIFNNLLATNATMWRLGAASGVDFLSNGLPSSVEFELGVLEPDVWEQFKSLGSASLEQAFLGDKAGNVQLFRRRVSIRNAPR